MHTPTGCPSPLLHFIELCTNRPAILHDSTLLVQPSLGTVSDFVLGSYVLSSKPKTKSGTTHSLRCSLASRGRSRTGHHVTEGALKLDAKSLGHFSSRPY